MKRFIKWPYRLHISLKDYLCLYCGYFGSAKDHIPPISRADNFPDDERLMVRSCTLCNCMLSNRPYNTIQERVEFLLIKYPIKFKKVLEMPHWTINQIDELKGILKRTIIKGMRKKEMIEIKINHLREFLNNIQQGKEYLNFFNSEDE